MRLVFYFTNNGLTVPKIHPKWKVERVAKFILTISQLSVSWLIVKINLLYTLTTLFYLDVSWWKGNNIKLDNPHYII